MQQSPEKILERLDLKTRPSKRLIGKKCRRLAKIFKVKSLFSGAEGFAFDLFKNNRSLDIFIKSLRIAEQKNTGKIVFFSDVYYCNEEHMTKFVETCRAGGLDVDTFDEEYPKVDFVEGVSAPDGVISFGYREMYRGRLVGVIL